MYWFHKVCQWQKRGIDIGEHLHHTFSIEFFPVHEIISISNLHRLDSGILYYLSNNGLVTRNSGTDFGLGRPKQTFEYRTFYFAKHEKMYSLVVPVSETNQFKEPSMNENKMNFLNEHKVMGKLRRVYDSQNREQGFEMGMIIEENPFEFTQELKTIIDNDGDDDNHEEDIYDPYPVSPEYVPVSPRVPALT